MGTKPVPTLIMVFEWDGKTVHKETKNFEGKNCVNATDFIDKALSASDKQTTFKPEYHKNDFNDGNRITA